MIPDWRTTLKLPQLDSLERNALAISHLQHMPLSSYVTPLACFASVVDAYDDHELTCVGADEQQN